ncbi:MAG: MFS transporter [Victivallaceae bacterium]
MAYTTTINVHVKMPELSPELAAYYSNNRLMWKNVMLIMLANVGWTISFAFLGPLMMLRLNRLGVNEGILGLLSSTNLWAVSFLVMYFSWKSDHCTSRWGRRLPFLFMSVPFIVLSILLFPFFVWVPMLIALTVVQMLATDVKSSTFPLLNIDCVRKDVLARMGAINAIACGLVAFFGVRYGVRLADVAEWLPYTLGSGIMCITTYAATFIKEPPIRNPTVGKFKPWSALKVGWSDKRNIIMMLGVGTIHAFMFMYGTWVWLYAKNALGIERADCANALSWSSLIGVALAYPIGWAIDKLGSYKIVAVFWVIEVIGFIYAMQVNSLNGLIVLSIIACVAMPFYTGADMLVYKACHPAVVGSMTSSNSFLRNMITGTIVLASGYMIQQTHNYKTAFILGIFVSTFGLSMFVFYYYLTVRPKAAEVETKPTLAEEGQCFIYGKK